MDTEELHYPPGAEPEKPAEEAKPDEKPEEPKAPEPEAEKPEETKPAEEKPQPEKPEDGKDAPPEPEVKKRSVYDDKKEEKQRRKAAEAELATERSAREAAEARATELQALLDKKDEAKTPEERKEAKDDLEAFAEKEGLKPEALKDLIGIISKRLPKPEGGALSKEEADEWRAERARAKVTAEDQEVLKQAPEVKKQLTDLGVSVHDEAEFTALMAEVVKLSHTKEFHDKDVDYIVFKYRDKLSKLISPKKPSFEEGGQREASGDGGDVEFNGKTTPAMAEEAMSKGPRPSYEFRKG